MQMINHSSLRTFDLNLLLAFDALMHELSVTRAAARLQIQQPAMSHALANLRRIFDDALFIRTGHVMEATVRAKALHAGIHPILLQMQMALLARTEFDAAKEERTFRLGINGQLEAIIMPALVAHAAQYAPGIRLQSVPFNDKTLHALLNEEQIDLAIGHMTENPPWHRREKLYREQYVCCFNPRLIACSAPVTADDYFAAMHALVSAQTDVSGFLAYLLQHAPAGLPAPHSSHNVMTVLAMAAQSPVIASLHGHVAKRYAAAFGLTVSPLPFDVDDLEIDMAWHPRSDNDPALDWLRALVRSCLP